MRRYALPPPPLLRGGFLALLLVACGPGLGHAQVPLTLLDQVDAPGRPPHEGEPLPAGTQAIILHYPADAAHTLDAAGLSREKLGRLVLNRLRSRPDSVELGEDGQTARRFPPTAESGEITYVLARTPSDSLYETYVNTGDGFVPGFDAVQSGRMAMGPVPPQPARRYRAVFRVYRAETGREAGSSSMESPSGEEASGDAAGPPSSSAAMSQSSMRDSSLAESGGGLGPVWAFLLGGLLGGAVGGGLVWYRLSSRLEKAEVERNNLRRRIKKRKNAEFRRATGSTRESAGDEEDERADDVDAAELERLKEENEELREHNESLERQIQEIKEYVQRLRDKSS